MGGSSSPFMSPLAIVGYVILAFCISYLAVRLLRTFNLSGLLSSKLPSVKETASSSLPVPVNSASGSTSLFGSQRLKASKSWVQNVVSKAPSMVSSHMPQLKSPFPKQQGKIYSHPYHGLELLPRTVSPVDTKAHKFDMKFKSSEMPLVDLADPTGVVSPSFGMFPESSNVAASASKLEGGRFGAPYHVEAPIPVMPRGHGILATPPLTAASTSSWISNEYPLLPLTPPPLHDHSIVDPFSTFSSPVPAFSNGKERDLVDPQSQSYPLIEHHPSPTPIFPQNRPRTPSPTSHNPYFLSTSPLPSTLGGKLGFGHRRSKSLGGVTVRRVGASPLPTNLFTVGSGKFVPGSFGTPGVELKDLLGGKPRASRSNLLIDLDGSSSEDDASPVRAELYPPELLAPLGGSTKSVESDIGATSDRYLFSNDSGFLTRPVTLIDIDDLPVPSDDSQNTLRFGTDSVRMDMPAEEGICLVSPPTELDGEVILPESLAHEQEEEQETREEEQEKEEQEQEQEDFDAGHLQLRLCESPLEASEGDDIYQEGHNDADVNDADAVGEIGLGQMEKTPMSFNQHTNLELEALPQESADYPPSQPSDDEESSDELCPPVDVFPSLCDISAILPDQLLLSPDVEPRSAVSMDLFDNPFDDPEGSPGVATNTTNPEESVGDADEGISMSDEPNHAEQDDEADPSHWHREDPREHEDPPLAQLAMEDDLQDIPDPELFSLPETSPILEPLADASLIHDSVGDPELLALPELTSPTIELVHALASTIAVENEEQEDNMPVPQHTVAECEDEGRKMPISQMPTPPASPPLIRISLSEGREKEKVSSRSTPEILTGRLSPTALAVRLEGDVSPLRHSPVKSVNDRPLPAWSLRATEAPRLGVTSTPPSPVLEAKELPPDTDSEQVVQTVIIEEKEDEAMDGESISPLPGSFPEFTPPPLKPETDASSSVSGPQPPTAIAVRPPSDMRSFATAVADLRRRASPLDIALAMQMRPGLGAGADPAWMVRFLMAVFGWFAVVVSGNIDELN